MSGLLCGLLWVLCLIVACVSALECDLAFGAVCGVGVPAAGAVCFVVVLIAGVVCGACDLVLRCGLASGAVCGAVQCAVRCAALVCCQPV